MTLSPAQALTVVLACAVFQSTFISILTPGGASLLTNLLWTLLNSGIALIGYWAAAFLIDDIYYGRLRMQLIGFIFVAALFYIGAGAYIPLTKPGGIHAFQFIYFFSSFWGQFGPNCTTFLLAGELYPTVSPPSSWSLPELCAWCSRCKQSTKGPSCAASV